MAKINAQGDLLAQVAFEMPNYEWLEDLAVDPEGNIILLKGDDVPPDY